MYKKEEKRGKKKKLREKEEIKNWKSQLFNSFKYYILYTYNEWHDKFSIMNKQ